MVDTDLQARFTKAAEEVKQLATKPSDEELLSLYALYKQATVGDNNTPKPGMFDLKGKYKWQRWFDLQGKTTEEAMSEYCVLVETLKASHG